VQNTTDPTKGEFETKNQEQIKKANKLIDTVDAAMVCQDLLDELNDLFEHEHYKLPE
jgi:hypothetical protein